MVPLLNSDRRADAVVLEALIVDQPANDLGSSDYRIWQE
jgi:hypothetical protein